MDPKYSTSLILSFIALINVSGSYNILYISPLRSGSHGILGMGYVRNLLKAGHQITYVTPFPVKENNAKFRQIDVSSVAILDTSSMDDVLNVSVLMNNPKVINDQPALFKMCVDMSYNTLTHENVQPLLKDTTQAFDLVIVDWVYNELMAGLSAVYGCPLIWASSMGTHWLITRLMDDIPSPAYAADLSSFNLPPFNFYQRVSELWDYTTTSYYRKFISFPKEVELYQEIFAPLTAMRGRKLPPYDEIMYNASLVLSNSHSCFDQTFSVPPNFKYIGGYHIEKPAKPLPEAIQNIMDKAEHGVIYFSLGSNWKSKDIPHHIKESLLKMFGEIKQTVIWKYEEDLPNRPKNLHIINWAPQTSILNHPNCKVFITHGGILSTTEAIYYGVPVIGIPLYLDQFYNLNKAVAKGIGKKMTLSKDIASDLKNAIYEVTTDKSYHENMMKLSAIFNDRLTTPEQELVFWVEHVIRTKGAVYLRSPTLALAWYQKFYLDLLAIVLALLIAFMVFIKCVCKFLFSSKPKKVKKN